MDNQSLSEIDYVAQLIEEHPAVGSYTQADNLLREAYYKTVKAYSSKTTPDPYGVSAAYPMFQNLDKEWKKQIEVYMAANVKDLTGYSLDEFLQLPLARATTLIEMLMDKTVRKNLEDKKALDQIQKDLK